MVSLRLFAAGGGLLLSSRQGREMARLTERSTGFSVFMRLRARHGEMEILVTGEGRGRLGADQFACSS